MEIVSTNIEDVLLLKPEVYRDKRGFFLETYREEHLRKRGIDTHFVQDNLSKSQQNTVRGLHYQIEQQQDKLLMVMQGRILDVAVDLRFDSPTFGQHTAVELWERNRHQLFIPKGFAHGFSVLSEEALVYYKCSDYYFPEGERGLRWNDPELGINWQIKSPIVSEKDQQQPLLKEIAKQDLF
ncbi:dTDP-4-dehydrorhamnose 3,5-epimerase [Fodinibius salsisoli]|uniref:dTDP-4-dehydrorhamnose 3,5-epimerase n=1 Tax=Fodinibius salsisoli TaxID=2820877 RepID=A0ABT3PIZ3_9BACT|nr:dTDP-4-dehydrorhamnose 3,5-epimerase [Fodinibius salsisoli]MCW9705904.1 dTDP-4-dehydrorhamnose 3,5-epimerase [Fodinibius salsisoli]